MQRIKVPGIVCPIPPALNKRVAEAERYALDWGFRLGLMPDGDTYGIGAAHIGYLASHAHPWVTGDALEIAVAWLDWLMVYDDALFDKRVNVTKLDRGRVEQIHRDLLHILDGAEDGDSDKPLYRGMADLYQSMRRLRPDWDMTDFVANMQMYFESNLWKATNIWRYRPPRLSVYTNMRRYTGCLFAMYRLSAALGGIALRPETRRHVALLQLEIMANNYTCWINDVYSFEREHVDGQVNNLVAVLRNERACTYQEAADEAIGMCRTEVESYLELKGTLFRLGLDDPALDDYLAVLESWMRALYDWHQMTGRYRVELPSI